MTCYQQFTTEKLYRMYFLFIYYSKWNSGLYNYSVIFSLYWITNSQELDGFLVVASVFVTFTLGSQFSVRIKWLVLLYYLVINLLFKMKFDKSAVFYIMVSQLTHIMHFFICNPSKKFMNQIEFGLTYCFSRKEFLNRDKHCHKTFMMFCEKNYASCATVASPGPRCSKDG